MTTNDAINFKIIASVLGGFNGLTLRLMNEKICLTYIYMYPLLEIEY